MDTLNNKKTILTILLVVLFTSVPFLNKAYHIDDTMVLHETKVILENPLDPFHGNIDWFGYVDSLWEVTTNPPFLSYYLAPFAALSDYSEVVLHAAMIPFLLMLAWSMVWLTQRFARAGYWPLLFVMTSCAVIVSGDVMRDVPAAGLGTMGATLYILGTDRNKRGYLFLGALLAGLAVLTKYSSIIFLPVMLLYPFFQRKYRLMLWIWPIILLFGLWCLHNQLYYGKMHFYYLLFERTEQSGIPKLDKLFGAFTVIGSIIYLFPILFAHFLRRKPWWVVGLGLCGLLLLRQYYHIDYNGKYQFIATLLGAAGGAMILMYLLQGLSYILDNLGRLILQTAAAVILLLLLWSYFTFYPGPISFWHYFIGCAGGAAILLCFAEDGKRAAVSLSKTIDQWLAHLIGLCLFLFAIWGMTVFYKNKLSLEFYFWAITGSLLLMFCLYEGLRRGIAYVKNFRPGEEADSLFLFAWLCAPALFSILFAPFQAVRHLIIALPPLTLLAFRYLDREPRLSPSALKYGLYFTLVIQTAMAFLIQTADMEYADSYRSFARYAKEKYSSKDYQTWYVGAWGWKFYCDRDGFRQVSRYQEFPKEGDILLWPQEILIGYVFFTRKNFPTHLGEPIDKVAYHGLIPIRTMNFGRGAGFYANVSCFGRIMLPYRLFDTYDPDILKVYRVPAIPPEEEEEAEKPSS